MRGFEMTWDEKRFALEISVKAEIVSSVLYSFPLNKLRIKEDKSAVRCFWQSKELKGRMMPLKNGVEWISELSDKDVICVSTPVSDNSMTAFV